MVSLNIVSAKMNNRVVSTEPRVSIKVRLGIGINTSYNINVSRYIEDGKL